jgi:hypothetical protein
MVLSGSKEGQGSTTFLKARQIRWWQAEEEGSHFLLKVSIFLSLNQLGHTRYEKMNGFVV